MREQKPKHSSDRQSLLDRTLAQYEQCYGCHLSDEDVFEIIHSLKSYSQALLDIHAGKTRGIKDER